MATEVSGACGDGAGPWRECIARSGMISLRVCVIAAGTCFSIVYVILGLHYELQLYADGSLFSYAVAVQDAWAFHWHNISSRLFIYAAAIVPAETYVGLTNDAGGGIALYGFLFFILQPIGLMATWAADGSKGRPIFAYACCSTACACPLVFGFPTEMLAAHAVFWPTLALCHCAPRGVGGIAGVFAALLALIFTHEGALILEGVILATLLLRGIGDAIFWRAAGGFLVALAVWTIVTTMLPADDYDGPMMRTAARHFFDLSIFVSPIILQLVGALTGYVAVYVVLRLMQSARAHLYAAVLVAFGLGAYWLWFDHSLHAEQRYYTRTVLLLATCGLGMLAGAAALTADGERMRVLPFLPRLMRGLASNDTARLALGAVVLVVLVHAVELGKFVHGWTDYKSAVRALATGTASDPALGDPHFVSSERIGGGLNQLSWFSTTPYLSVLVAPGYRPSRLVVDPSASYFWLSCATARANEAAPRAIPAETRALVRVHACLHR